MTKKAPNNQFKKIVAVLFINIIILTYIALQTDEERYQAGVEAYHEHNFSKTYNIMSSLAGQDYAPAQYFLATLYVEGKGVEPDEKLAASWFEKAAKLGYTNSEKSLQNNTIKVE